MWVQLLRTAADRARRNAPDKSSRQQIETAITDAQERLRIQIEGTAGRQSYRLADVQAAVQQAAREGRT